MGRSQDLHLFWSRYAPMYRSTRGATRPRAQPVERTGCLPDVPSGVRSIHSQLAPTLPSPVDRDDDSGSPASTSPKHAPPPPLLPFTAPTAPGPSGTASPPGYYSARGKTARCDSTPARPRRADCTPTGTHRCSAGTPRPRAGGPARACWRGGRRGRGRAGRRT